MPIDKEGASVTLELENIIALGIVAISKDFKEKCVALLDADILVPVSECTNIRMSTGLELAGRTSEQIHKSYKIRNYIMTNYYRK